MKTIKFFLVLALALAMALGMSMPAQSVQADGSLVLVWNLVPSWTEVGGGGVFSAYIGLPAYGAVSPGTTDVFDGREAGIIKAGLAVDPVDGVYEDEGLFGFIPNVTINDFAAGTLTYDVENQNGENPVWMTIEIDMGVGGSVTYQFVPTTNPAGWNTFDAAVGLWQKWNNNDGDVTGNPPISLSAVAAANTGLNVVRAYLRLGMGDSYHGTAGLGTVAWVDKATLGGVTYDFVVSTLGVTTDKTVFCGSADGDKATVSIDISKVVDLFGYQFQVSYDASKVSATGAFVDSWFNTVNIDPDTVVAKKANCGGGVCEFFVSKVDPQAPVSDSGTVAQITFTGNAPGAFNVTVSDDILANRDGALPHTTAAPLNLTVCGFATVSGVVSLQGRATPIDAGTVTLTDGAFGPYETNFDPGTGAFTIPNVKVMPGGTSYTFDASHGLYLGNQMTYTLNPGDSYAAPLTKLKGGDANNSGAIDVDDLICVAGAFGGPPVVCGATGRSDINADTTTNILDLVLVDGNYGLASPQGW